MAATLDRAKQVTVAELNAIIGVCLNNFHQKKSIFIRVCSSSATNACARCRRSVPSWTRSSSSFSSANCCTCSITIRFTRRWRTSTRSSCFTRRCSSCPTSVFERWKRYFCWISSVFYWNIFALDNLERAEKAAAVAAAAAAAAAASQKVDCSLNFD